MKGIERERVLRANRRVVRGDKKNRVFESRERLFEGINARRFESKDAAV